MKHCPTCNSDYPDEYRFCRLDGAALVKKHVSEPIVRRTLGATTAVVVGVLLLLIIGRWIFYTVRGVPPPNQEADKLRVGQSSRGISLHPDGKLLFNGEEIGQFRDVSAAQALLSAPSPKRGLIYVNHSDLDWGGLQGSIVDPSAKTVVIKSMLPDERVRGRGKAERVVQLCEDISWSPDEHYAITVQCAEVIRHIVVVDLANRKSHVLHIGSLERDDCDRQHFEMKDSSWMSPSTYRLRVVLGQNPWAQRACEPNRFYPTYDLIVDAHTLEVKRPSTK